MLRAPAAPGPFPPEHQVAVVTLACQRTDAHDRPRHGWSLDEIAATIINEAHAEAISRATVWRILQAADWHPHQSV
jgi:hypothetical protein